MIRKTIVTVFGFGFLFLGIVMILLPGPAFIFIPLGIAILSLEYAWADRLLERIKAWFRSRKVTDKESAP